MADLFAEAAQMLADELKAHASVDVTLERGGQSTTGVKATLGHSMLRLSTSTGQTVTVRTERDFIIQAADYKIGGVAVEPKAGDKITVTVLGSSKRYECMSPGGGEPAWRYCDGQQVAVRVHTKYRPA